MHRSKNRHTVGSSRVVKEEKSIAWSDGRRSHSTNIISIRDTRGHTGVNGVNFICSSGPEADEREIPRRPGLDDVGEAVTAIQRVGNVVVSDPGRDIDIADDVLRIDLRLGGDDAGSKRGCSNQ